MKIRLTCGKCSYMMPMDNMPDMGICCVNPPIAVPAMQAAPLQPGAIRPTAMGIDPPVKRERRACHHFVPEALDG